ncbi:methyltransferase [Bdellovibrio sp. KM01]|uniref:methyltransferase n=1 Tax=Bdellovibrio sp. KM01 TaxID=2748865 RepID=UPI0015E9EC84|nr:methyltransferase [Bdellovibrio sp. KM01]QLY24426.1 methyltransferase domain-containing protein [Bdellovibrio sp. KM01]
MQVTPVTTPAAKELLPQDAKFMAQFIAMAPFVFQTAVCLRDFGILNLLCENPEGLSTDTMLEKINLSRYSLNVLLDAGESSGILLEKNKIWKITQTGMFLEKDAITRVNMNFSQDVCYQGLFNLKDALETNTPTGLKVFGNWSTLYEGLSSLPEKVQQSWFEFDHFFSSDSFPRALPIVFKDKPKKILDVGGNTGKFAVACTKFDNEVNVTIADHPGQIEMAKANASSNQVADRIHYHVTDLLKKDEALPQGHDVIWMSQLLSCFSDEDVVMLLKKARAALGAGGSLYIMETFTDNQKFNTARFCLDMTSLYFTVMANGNSRMYRSEEFYKLIEKAEMKIVEEHPFIRLNHTILKCVPA